MITPGLCFYVCSCGYCDALYHSVCWSSSVLCYCNSRWDHKLTFPLAPSTPAAWYFHVDSLGTWMWDKLCTLCNKQQRAVVLWLEDVLHPTAASRVEQCWCHKKPKWMQECIGSINTCIVWSSGDTSCSSSSDVQTCFMHNWNKQWFSGRRSIKEQRGGWRNAYSYN